MPIKGTVPLPRSHPSQGWHGRHNYTEEPRGDNSTNPHLVPLRYVGSIRPDVKATVTQGDTSTYPVHLHPSKHQHTNVMTELISGKTVEY